MKIRSRPLYGILCLALFVSAAQPVFAWGKNGHRAIGEIAQRYLSAAATVRVERILAGRSLASASTWADEIRSDPTWNCAAPFHYVTVPPGDGRPSERYPEGAGSGGDVVKALAWYSRVLEDGGDAGEDQAKLRRQREALAFLVHFVGDVHQPLHVGLGCDQGGNTVSVQWFGQPRALHSVWDSGMIEHKDLSFLELARFVDHQPVEPGPTSAFERDRAAPILEWLNEAQEQLPRVYTCFAGPQGDRCPCYQGDCPGGDSVFGGCPLPRTSFPVAIAPGPPRLGYQYLYSNWPYVEEQLLKAGLRLAQLLDWALGDQAPPEHFLELEKRLSRDAEWSAPFEVCVGPE